MSSHGMTAGEVPGELQQVPHAGSAETVDALVVVSHHADVAVMAAQAQEDTLLGAGGVLVLIADQVPDAGGDGTGGPAVLKEFGGPPLQVIEVRAALPLEQVLVPLVGTAQRDVEGVSGSNQFPWIDELIAEPLEELEAMADHQVRFAPAPARSLQGIQVRAEDVIEVAGQETPLLILVQHREVRPGVAATAVGTQDAAAQAVDGAGAYPGEVSRATGGGGQGGETLPQFPRRGPGIGAQHQLLRFGQPAQQYVGSPEGHR